MKGDLQLQRDVRDQLRWAAGLDAAEIVATAAGGVLVLTGYANSFAERYLAIAVAEQVDGVLATVDHLEVKRSARPARTDAELAHRAVDALRTRKGVPLDRLRVTVREGRVTMEGEVDSPELKAASERAVHDVAGVRRLTNLVSVRPALSSASSRSVSPASAPCP